MTQGISALKERLSDILSQLDARNITPPIEIAVGDYSFYPYHGFSDMLARKDFAKLTQPQLGILVAICEDILAMKKPDFFESFVDDDGILAIEETNAPTEYTIDVLYNERQTRVESIHPQITFPENPTHRHVDDGFVRNTVAHEILHHADYWLDIRKGGVLLEHMHSSSTVLAACARLDKKLNPHGLSDWVAQVRNAEGYVPKKLYAEGYSRKHVNDMMKAEFFAIAGEYYFGSRQKQRLESVLLDAYFVHIVMLDLEITKQFVMLKDKEQKRGVLRKATHRPLRALLGRDYADWHSALTHSAYPEAQDLLYHALVTLSKDIAVKLKIDIIPSLE